MKAFIGLTILQALFVEAVPHHRKAPCISSSLVVKDPTTTLASSEKFPAPALHDKVDVAAIARTTITIRKTRTSTIFVEEVTHAPSSDSQETEIFGSVEEASDGALFVSDSDSERNNADPTIPIAKSWRVTYSGATTSFVVISTSGALTTPAVSTVPESSASHTGTFAQTGSSDLGGIFFQVTTSTVIASVSVSIASSSSGIIQVLPDLSTQVPSASGTVVTSVEALGALRGGPLISTSIPAPSTTISPTGPVSSATTSVIAGVVSDDIFQPVATNAPPSVLVSRPDHPVPRLGIQPQNSSLETNKFYANFFLGSQTAATWTHPYSVAWSKGGGSSGSWGMSISHIDNSQRVFGPDPTVNPVEYFANPVGIQSLILSALELGASSTLSIDTLTAFSVNVNLLPNAGAQPAITFPLVQGMGFVTGIYNGGTPILQTGVFFNSITKATTSPQAGVTKYIILLEDGNTWLLYAYSPSGIELDFAVVSHSLVQATSNFDGFIQIAKDPGGGADSTYDTACGVYPTTAKLSGSISGATGSYTLAYSKAGLTSTALLMFALPHHVASFDSNTSAALTSVQLDTTTKGVATAVVADSWTLVEALPTTMGFAPWAPSNSSVGAYSAASIAAIQLVAAGEVSQNMSDQTDLNSMYYSGKALAKFAGIVYTLHDIVQDQALAQAGLTSLESAFAVFASNIQEFPLVYETAWGGVVSSASYTTGDSGADFGNTYYNDHHFHYGYFIYTAAVIGYLDPSWLTANKDYVNALVRDIANPSTEDNYFPVSRMFDWYHGHSWAHGLYETFDGKDEESSSEDSMSAYAIKMWGRTIGDANMEARGNLQLAVTARSLQSYFLYTSTNTIQPANFIGNKVSGIMFENKVDHTTYFGTNIEYIQGIHMLPLLPHSTLTRTQEFVEEEWNTYFSNGRADTVVGGWKGILFANLAIVDPVTAWQFFSQSGFDVSWLDGGASRTWYMALAAGLGGAN